MYGHVSEFWSLFSLLSSADYCQGYLTVKETAIIFYISCAIVHTFACLNYMMAKVHCVVLPLKTYYIHIALLTNHESVCACVVVVWNSKVKSTSVTLTMDLHNGLVSHVRSK